MKSEKGITIITLIVTIILLLILAGTSIGIAIKTDLFNRARKVVNNMNNKTEQIDEQEENIFKNDETKKGVKSPTQSI